MRIDFKSRLVRASAAIAVGLVAVAGVASTASAQSCNTPWSNCGWTWGERYGAPPGTSYYPQQGYYPQQQYYRQPYYQPQPSYYGSNPQAAAGQLFGMFVR